MRGLGISDASIDVIKLQPYLGSDLIFVQPFAGERRLYAQILIKRWIKNWLNYFFRNLNAKKN